jgi:ArsR family transcriptional regulator, lead/cadmium/zinc/bismuth-responsive transcriptional repressor
MNCLSYDDFFSNFSNKTKLKIIMSLRRKAMSVNELVEILGEEQSKVSHNLRKMTRCNILAVKKEGKRRIYSLNKKTVMPMLGLVDQHVKNYCDGRCKEC